MHVCCQLEWCHPVPARYTKHETVFRKSLCRFLKRAIPVSCLTWSACLLRLQTLYLYRFLVFFFIWNNTPEVGWSQSHQSLYQKAAVWYSHAVLCRSQCIGTGICPVLTGVFWKGYRWGLNEYTLLQHHKTWTFSRPQTIPSRGLWGRDYVWTWIYNVERFGVMASLVIWWASPVFNSLHLCSCKLPKRKTEISMIQCVMSL